MGEKMYVLDAHSRIYQLFHGMREMNAPDGTPTHAVFGFTRDLLKIRYETQPDYFVVAMDASEETFRHEFFPDYKANRTEQPDDLRPQIPLILEIVQAFGIPIVAQPGYEADDFMASIAQEARRRKIQTYLCTSDKDMRQVVGSFVVIYDLLKHRVIDSDFVKEDWGIKPEQVVDFQALVGDSVDNVPGCPSVGPKTAAELLQEFETLEKIFENLEKVKRKKIRENLEQFRDQILLSRRLVQLKEDLPLPTDWEIWKPRTPDYDRLVALFQRCGFQRFTDEVRARMPKSAVASADWQTSYKLIQEPWDFDQLLVALQSCTRLSVDLETTSLHPTQADIVGIALATGPGQAFYLPIQGPADSELLPLAPTLDRLRPVLENPMVQKIGQNLKYDFIVFRRAGITLRGIAGDSMLASYLLEAGERNHNLDDMARRYLNHETIKITDLFPTTGKTKPAIRMETVPLPKITEYAAEDADVAWRLCAILEAQLADQQLETLYREVELPLLEVLAEMELQGINLDLTVLQEVGQEFSERLQQYQTDAYKHAGQEFNLDSPTQLRKLLFDELKLPVVKSTKSGPSTDQEVLEELADLHPLCRCVLEYRKLAKLQNTYLDTLPNLLHPQTKRIHASFNQTVTATGRLSSSDPNLQNIPIRTEEGRQLRRAFLPCEPDWLLFCADYSQIELRFLAYFTQDPHLVAAFVEDRDIHAAVAAQVTNKSIEEVTSEERRLAKTINFGIMYGLSAFGLSRRLKISETAAEQFIEAYFAKYPKINTFFTQVLEQARDQQVVKTILGRRRQITGIRETTGLKRNTAERTAINTVIQGSAADLIKLAMLKIQRRLQLQQASARLLLQIHDELVFEVPKTEVDLLATWVQEEMTQALNLGKVPLKVDLSVGRNWLEQLPFHPGIGSQFQTLPTAPTPTTNPIVEVTTT